MLLTWDDKGCLGSYPFQFEEHFPRVGGRVLADLAYAIADGARVIRDFRVMGDQRNPNTIPVLETGTATTMPWLSQVKSVVEAWYPGQEQGTALARLLFGDANFSGRLPMTFPRSLADIPTSTPAQYPGVTPAGSAIDQVTYSEGLDVGYKWYEARGIRPLFPFGYGPSYTSFRLSHLSATVHRPRQSPGLRVTFSNWDTGRAAWVIAPGSCGVRVGSSSRDLPLAASVRPGR